jgi:hypothetical protein
MDINIDLTNLVPPNDSTATTNRPPSKQSVKNRKGIHKPLTRKQEAFVTELIKNPKMSATQAIKNTYNVSTNHSAEVMASENLRKPEIISRLGDANNMIEQVLMDTVGEYGNSDKIQERSLAVDTSKWIHDKIHGKAVQKSSSVNFNFTQHVGDKSKDYGL